MRDAEKKYPPFFSSGHTRSSNRFSRLQTNLRSTFNDPSRVDVHEIVLHAKKHAADVLQAIQSVDTLHQYESINNRNSNLLLTPQKAPSKSSALIQYSPLGRTHHYNNTPKTRIENKSHSVSNLKTLLSQLLIALD